MRTRPADIHDHQTQGATDSSIGTKPMAKSIVATVETNLESDRTVNNRPRCGRKQCDIQAVRTQSFVTQAFHSGEHNG
jgi:hypothetical protein